MAVAAAFGEGLLTFYFIHLALPGNRKPHPFLPRESQKVIAENTQQEAWWPTPTNIQEAKGRITLSLRQVWAT